VTLFFAFDRCEAIHTFGTRKRPLLDLLQVARSDFVGQARGPQGRIKMAAGSSDYFLRKFRQVFRARALQ